MALDFYNLSSKEYLFCLDDERFDHLSPIFEMYQQWTGMSIDPYTDMKLSTANCDTLVQVIDKYIQQTDLNKNKLKTTAILGFRGLIEFFINKNIDFELHGD